MERDFCWSPSGHRESARFQLVIGRGWGPGGHRDTPVPQFSTFRYDQMMEGEMETNAVEDGRGSQIAVPRPASLRARFALGADV